MGEGIKHATFPSPVTTPATAPTPRSGHLANTLRLLAYLTLSLILLVGDHRSDWLEHARAGANVVIAPIWWLAGLPSRFGHWLSTSAATHTRLVEDNTRLRNELLVMSARQARLQVEAEENARLRGLMAAAERGGLNVQLAPILNVDLDPTRQRLVLNIGQRAGVQPGQSVIDAGGLLGQVTAVTPGTATVLLVTDLDHAVPVVVTRSGVRLVAYGTGRGDRLELRNIALSSDVQIGDTLITSGMGGRFPPGFPVGTVTALHPDDTQAFLIAELKPAAQLDRGRDVLLLHEITPPAPEDAPAEPAEDSPP